MSVLDLLFGKKIKKSNVRKDILDSLKTFRDTFFDKWNLRRTEGGLDILSNEVEHKLDFGCVLLNELGNKLSENQNILLRIVKEYVDNMLLDHLISSGEQDCCEALDMFCEAVKALNESDKAICLAALKLQKSFLEQQWDEVHDFTPVILSDESEISNAENELLEIFDRYNNSEKQENLSLDELHAIIANCSEEEKNRLRALGKQIERMSMANDFLRSEFSQVHLELNQNKRHDFMLRRKDDLQLKAADFSHTDFLSRIADSIKYAQSFRTRTRYLVESQHLLFVNERMVAEILKKIIDHNHSIAIINETINNVLARHTAPTTEPVLPTVDEKSI